MPPSTAGWQASSRGQRPTRMGRTRSAARHLSCPRRSLARFTAFPTFCFGTPSGRASRPLRRWRGQPSTLSWSREKSRRWPTSRLCSCSPRRPCTACCQAGPNTCCCISLLPLYLGRNKSSSCYWTDGGYHHLLLLLLLLLLLIIHLPQPCLLSSARGALLPFESCLSARLRGTIRMEGCCWMCSRAWAREEAARKIRKWLHRHRSLR